MKRAKTRRLSRVNNFVENLKMKVEGHPGFKMGGLFWLKRLSLRMFFELRVNYESELRSLLLPAP